LLQKREGLPFTFVFLRRSRQQRTCSASHHGPLPPAHHTHHRIPTTPTKQRQQDLENTTGAWDLYGQDSDKRYNGLQADFFTRAADIVSRRQVLG
jgi:hypothetical protein